MDKDNIILIRPMVYINEASIKNVSKKYNFPIIHNSCPVDKKTKREDIKELIYKLESQIPGFKKNLFGSRKSNPRLARPLGRPAGQQHVFIYIYIYIYLHVLPIAERLMPITCWLLPGAAAAVGPGAVRRRALGGGGGKG